MRGWASKLRGGPSYNAHLAHLRTRHSVLSGPSGRGEQEHDDGSETPDDVVGISDVYIVYVATRVVGPVGVHDKVGEEPRGGDAHGEKHGSGSSLRPEHRSGR